MRVCTRGQWFWVVALGVWVSSAPAQEKQDVEKRVKELLAVINHPDARGERLEASVAAQKELVKIGEPAVPQLVETVLRNRDTDQLAFIAARLLVDIGKPALPALRAKWPDWNDERRWRFMPVFEKHDRESVREYAWNCLDAKGWARDEAWGFMLRTKDKRAKAVYFDILESGGDEPDHIRWMLLPGEKEVYDFKRENKILIDLLAKDSWVAKGKGQMTPEGTPPPWWPDGRPQVIQVLHDRKVKEAAPALLKVLQEQGEGGGYLAEHIIPALADLGDDKAIPELEKIAAHLPKPKHGKDAHPHNLSSYEEVRKLASDAIKTLKSDKR